MAQPGADQAQTAALLDRVNETTGMWIAGLVFLAAGPASRAP